jgi:hypothetical protein
LKGHGFKTCWLCLKQSGNLFIMGSKPDGDKLSFLFSQFWLVWYWKSVVDGRNFDSFVLGNCNGVVWCHGQSGYDNRLEICSYWKGMGSKPAGFVWNRVEICSSQVLNLMVMSCHFWFSQFWLRMCWLDEILAYSNRDGRDFGLFVLRHSRIEHGVITNWLWQQIRNLFLFKGHGFKTCWLCLKQSRNLFIMGSKPDDDKLSFLVFAILVKNMLVRRDFGLL